MLHIKSALYAFGLAALLSGSVLHGSLAADGDRYILFATEKNYEKLNSGSPSYSIIIGAFQDWTHDVEKPASSRFKKVSITATNSDYVELFGNLLEGRIDLIAIPESEVESGKIKSIKEKIGASKARKFWKDGVKESLNKAPLLALDEPLTVQD